MQCAADGTTALRAVRCATENARFDATLKIGRIVGGHFGEEAVLRIAWGMKDSVRHAVGNQKLWILAMQRGQALSEGGAIIRGQHFGTLLTELRGVNAYPNAVDLRASAPERDIVLQVVVASEHGTRDDPMGIDLAAFYVLENALVGCGLAANIVMLGETVDGNRDAQARDAHPLHRDGNHGAGNHESEYTQLAEGGENAAQLAMTDQRFAAHQGNVERLMLAHKLQDAIDERRPAQVI